MFDVKQISSDFIIENEISIIQIPDGMIILSQETRMIFKSEFCCLKFRMTSTQTENIFQNKAVDKSPPEKNVG